MPSLHSHRRLILGLGASLLVAILAIVASQSSTQAAETTSNGWRTSASVSHPSPKAGTQVTIRASLRSTTTRSALVDVEIFDATGGRVFAQSLDAQAFVAGRARAFPFAWRPATAGNYIVKVGVFSPGWGTLYHWNNEAATVVVTAVGTTPTPTPTPTPASTPSPSATPAPPATVTPPYVSNGWITAVVSPSTVGLGGTLGIAAAISSNSTVSALIDIEVFDSSGARVFAHHIDNQLFTANQQKVITTSWRPTANGRYVTKVGVFSPGWGTLWHWNNAAAAITVNSSGTPTPTATASPTPMVTPSATPTPTVTPGSGLPALPPQWPATLQLGISDAPGGAAVMRATTSFGVRYQYLAGGVNTGGGWANWNTDGSFVTNYVRESAQQGMTSVFSYYQLLQSAPGNAQGADGQASNLQNTATMTAYYRDLKLFFQRTGATSSSPVILHVEPDLWGYIQQRATSDNPATVPVQVASTGLSELAGLPNNAAGLAQAIIRLRDAYAPNVQLAYHVSVWGTGNDIVYSKPSNAVVAQVAQQAARYYRALGANFDMVFAEFSDRDSGFKQSIYGDQGASWWAPADFERNVLFLSTFVQATQKRLVMWQIPLGNTKMRSLNNSWNHYQDNRVEWLLDDPSRAHLNAYVQAGVIGFLFGRGADGATCACDANGDGVTNPSPINGNGLAALTADDDGGFFRQKAKAYYSTGAIPLR